MGVKPANDTPHRDQDLSVEVEWWQDLMDAHADDGFTILEVTLPCGHSP
jgi:hypothetical protein